MEKLFDAYEKKNIAEFKKNLENIKNPHEFNYIRKKNRNILELICEYGTLSDNIYLELILQHGADPNHKNMAGHHILSNCFNRRFNNIRMFELLLEYGANINYTKDAGYALHSICINGFDSNYLEAVKLAMKFGAYNCFLFKHYSLGSMKTIDVCKMLISPYCSTNGFGNSENPYITQCIITLLEQYSPIIMSYQGIRKNKLAEVERLRLAEVERLRSVEVERLRLVEVERLRLADIERLRLAEVERLRLVNVERLRLVNVERLRLADIERLRLADIERLRLADIERLRLVDVERLRLAEVERLRLAEVERLRLADIEKLRLVDVEKFKSPEIEQSELKKNEEESFALLSLAIKNLEFLCQNENVPDDLKSTVNNMTSQLLIKVGQKMPKHILDTLEIPDEYKHIIDSKDNFIAFWEKNEILNE